VITRILFNSYGNVLAVNQKCQTDILKEIKMRLGIFVLFILVLVNSSAMAFSSAGEGKGAGNCVDCHTLSVPQANEIFKNMKGEVVSAELSEVPGLWKLGVQVQDKILPAYLDFSKSYMISGNVIRLSDGKNLTEETYRKFNPVDVSSIPVDDALLLGNPDAENKIIVFTDPHCPYCKKLHDVMKEAVEKRSDLLFQIKLFPVKQSSLEVSKTIVCSKSMEQLETAFEKKALPEAECNAEEVLDQTRAIAQSLGIRSTPTMVLPDGQIAPGYKKLEALMQIIDQNSVVKTAQE
jgi:thiol:disulfide interchange protein DsbC